MEEEDRNVSWRERRARKKEEKRGERPPDVAGRQVYPPPQGEPRPAQAQAVPTEPGRPAQPVNTGGGAKVPPGDEMSAGPSPASGARPVAGRPGTPVAGAARSEAGREAGRPDAGPAGHAAGPQVPAQPPGGGPTGKPTPEEEAQARGEASPAQPQPVPYQPAQPQGAPQPFPHQPQPPQGYFWPPPWYPPAYPPPGYAPGAGYPPGPYPPPGFEYAPVYGYPPAPGQTGQMPPVPAPPPGAPPAPEWVQPPGAPPAVLHQPVEMTEEEAEFRGLTGDEVSHWRVDLKWIFGVAAAVLLFATLTVAGMYRSTSPGIARDVLEPLVGEATEVREQVEENYSDLRSKARRSTSASFVVPDIGVQVTVKAQDINRMSADELADTVVAEVAKQIYAQGYKGNLPMPEPRGVGEERARATVATLLSVLNRKTHGDLLWPLIVLAVLTAAMGVMCAAFCRGWGRAVGLGIVIIAAALPPALLVRINGEFVLGPSTGVFRGASHQALRALSGSTLLFYDIALAAGAIVLLAGIIGVVVAKKTRERVPPFIELARPERAVAGGPPLEPGLTTPPDTD